MIEQQPSQTFPFDDDFMIYDYSTHRYVLTEKGVLTELGENLNLILNPTGDANTYIKKQVFCYGLNDKLQSSVTKSQSFLACFFFQKK